MGKSKQNRYNFKLSGKDTEIHMSCQVGNQIELGSSDTIVLCFLQMKNRGIVWFIFLKINFFKYIYIKGKYT